MVNAGLFLWITSALTFAAPDHTRLQLADYLLPPVELSTQGHTPFSPPLLPPTDGDTLKNPNNHRGDGTHQPVFHSPLYLNNPQNVQVVYELAPDGKGYYVHERVGNQDIHPPSYITREAFIHLRLKQTQETYWRELSLAQGDTSKKGKGLIPTFDLAKVNDVFGGGTIDIRPVGTVGLRLGVNHSRNDNPFLPRRQQRNTYFDFPAPQIQMGMNAKIGEKIKFDLNYDTQSLFNLDNLQKLKYTGNEDQILQSVQAGNVSFPLGNTLIQGRQNLMGLLVGTKWGPVRVTAIAGVEQGKNSCITIPGGTNTVQTPFKKVASKYDAKRHYFLNHYFRSKYESALNSPIFPLINSEFRITRVEVYVTNQQATQTQNLRAAVGLLDLGENDAAFGGRIFNASATGTATGRYPDNQANPLFAKLKNNPDATLTYKALPALTSAGLRNSVDFELVNSLRRLQANEYRLNDQLGYISLTTPLRDDQVLMVAFEYSSLADGKVYQVGEFSTDVPATAENNNALLLKLLKPSLVRPAYNGESYPAWDLMMKNIYNTEGYNLTDEEFYVDVFYETATTAGRINFLPQDPSLPPSPIADEQLMQVMGIDRLTNNTAPKPDNYFDFVEGLTVLAEKGLVIFPVLEPFGSHLAAKFGNDPQLLEKYVFSALYTETQADAENKYTQYNRFSIEGFYQSKSSGSGTDIPLNAMNLAQGSVRVTMGSTPLTENTHFRVDYQTGRLQILDPSVLQSGQDIKICFEGSTPYSQNKSMMGARVETDLARDVTIGASILRMRNRPLTPKTSLGDEAYANTLWGLDVVAKRDLPGLTKALDRLPLLQTKAPSKIEANIEFAQFVPGQPKAVPAVYIDDFEASKTTYLLQGVDKWKISSLPATHIAAPHVSGVQTDLLELKAGFNRAQLSWYSIDFTSFFSGNRPEVPDEDLANNYTRQIMVQELFANSTPAIGNQVKNPLDLLYIPTRRGPYNYQTSPARLDADGSFTHPEENWAGITRPVDFGSNNDFEATNIEYLEFWLMDPFLEESPNDGSGGDLYLNLGRISEDVIADGIQTQENALPLDVNSSEGVIPSPWGRMTTIPPTNQSFPASASALRAQDVGFDGLANPEEKTHFLQYPFLTEVAKVVQGDALATLEADPSSDDFYHFRADAYETGESVPILTRFSRFNGMEGNTPAAENATRDGYTISGTNQPDGEDVNRNNAPNFIDEYWEYHISLRPGDLEQGKNYIVYAHDTVVRVSGGGGATDKQVRWYQFRVPLREGTSVNGASNFKSVDFMRLYMTGFKDTVILRMVDFQFVQTQWRRYEYDLCENCTGNSGTFFEQGSISYQENSERLPFNYTYPPETPSVQQNNAMQAGTQIQDERSMVMRVCDLAPGDAKAIYRILPYDLRNYERLKLWVHAEPYGVNSNFAQAGDLNGFMRLGLDNDLNYYEYEINLLPSEARAMPARSAADIANIWSNQFDIQLSYLVAAKAARDAAGFSLAERYEYVVPETGDRIYVKGTPKISDIATVMIGLRNPSTHDASVCAEVWINELRVTDFKENKSAAANANISLTLADFATLSATGSYRQAGFGPLDQRVSSRSLEDSWQYSLRAAIAVDKLLPKAWGLSIPVTVTRSDNVVRPLYDPMQADVSVASLMTQEGANADSIRARVETRQQTRGIALTNVKKARTDGPAIPSGKPAAASQTPGQPPKPDDGGDKPKVPMPYDISNFDFSFAYNERLSSSPSLERKLILQHTGAINYNYALPKMTIAPFKKVKFMKKPNPIKDMSFNPLPAMVTVSVNGERNFQERQLRAAVGFDGNVSATYAKNFLINRVYTVAWPLTPNLTANFNATTVARVDEVRGYWDSATEAERDSVGTLASNLLHIGRSDEVTASGRLRYPALVNMGRPISYNQNLTFAYQLPFSKYKTTNFISGNVNYTATVQWQQAPEAVPNIGGLMANSRSIQGTAKADLGKLYQKIKPLKEVLAEAQRQGPAGKPYKPNQSSQPGPRPSRAPRISREQADDTRFMIPNPPPQPQQPTQPAPEKQPKDTSKVVIPKALKVIATQTARVLLSVQSVDMNYQRTDGTRLPGYLPSVSNFGLFNRYDEISGISSPSLPPTAGFVLGDQGDIRQLGATSGWLTQNELLSDFYKQNFNEQLTLRASVEPVKALRIDLSFMRSSTEDFQELFRWNTTQNDYISSNQYLVGNYSTSYIFINTAFEAFPDSSSDFRSEVFEEFRRTRSAISARWYEANTAVNGQIPAEMIMDSSLGPDYQYYNGYLGSSQQVLIPSLLATYGVFGSDKVSLSALPKVILPNWQINYNPMTAFPKLKSTFTAISFRHSYTGKYSTGSFLLNLNAIDTLNPYINYRDPEYISPNLFVLDTLTSGQLLYNYLPTRTVANVVVEENFSPLIGVNMTLKNGIGATLAYNKGRNLALSAGAMQLNEERKRDITFSLTYRKRQFSKEPVNFLGKKLKMQNPFEAKMSFSLRENIILIRYVDGDRTPTVTQGNRAINISPSASYTVSKRMTVGLAYDGLFNRPHTLQSYRTANHRVYVDIKFSFN